MLKVSEGHIVRIVFAMNVKGHERANQYVIPILDETPRPTYARLCRSPMSQGNSSSSGFGQQPQAREISRKIKRE